MTTITELINGPHRDYARYVVFSRAIPSLMDGMKPSQRKIFWTATNHAKKFTKTAALCGQVIVEADYHHGDSSLQAAASLMAAPWANNFPLLEGEGNFGSRIVQVPAAARYTSVRVNPEIYSIFLDNEDCSKSKDGNEPEFFLPILPIVAINGSSGMAVGFATDIFPRSKKSISDFVKKILAGEIDEKRARETHIKPSFPHFSGPVREFKDNDRSTWIVSGKIERDKRNTIVITELPTGYSREGYIEKLEKLIDKGVINDYTDETSKGQFRFTLKVPSTLLKKTDGEILNDLKLVVKMTENIVVISPDSKVTQYETIGSLVWDFVQARLAFYPVRFGRLLSELETDLLYLEMKARIIRRVMMTPAEYFNSSSSKSNQREKFRLTLQSHSFLDFDISANMDRLVNLPAYSFTSETLEETEKKARELREERKRIQTMTPQEEFMKDLEKAK